MADRFRKSPLPGGVKHQSTAGVKQLEIGGSKIPRSSHSHLPSRPQVGRAMSPPSPSSKTATPTKSGVQPKIHTFPHSLSVDEPDQRTSERERRRNSQPHPRPTLDASRQKTSLSESQSRVKSSGAGSKSSQRSSTPPLSTHTNSGAGSKSSQPQQSPTPPLSTATNRYSRPRDSAPVPLHTANSSQHKSRELEGGQNLVSLGDGAVGRMRDVDEGALLSLLPSSDDKEWERIESGDVPKGQSLTKSGRYMYEELSSAVSSLSTGSRSHSTGSRPVHSREVTQTMVALQDMENRYQSELRMKDVRIHHLEKQLSENQSYLKGIENREKEQREELCQCQKEVEALKEENKQLKAEFGRVSSPNQARFDSGSFPSGETLPSMRQTAQCEEHEATDQDKAIVGTSINMSNYKRAISNASSESSTAELVSERQRRESEQILAAEQVIAENRDLKDQITELVDQISQLKEQYDSEVTHCTEEMSTAEEKERKLVSENKKLQHKLTEAQEVAAQLDNYGTEWSEFSAKEKDYQNVIAKLEREKMDLMSRMYSGGGRMQAVVTASDFSTQPLQSQELETLRHRLEREKEASAELESQLRSLKQSLVCPGKREGGEGRKHADLLAEIHGLKQKLEETENSAKKQLQAYGKLVDSLKAKLSAEREEKQKLLSARPGNSSSEVFERERLVGSEVSRGTAELSQQLAEKDEAIRDLNAKLQKTAENVTKIFQHSKSQSEVIATLKEDLKIAEADKASIVKAKEEEMSQLQARFNQLLRKKEEEVGLSAARAKGEELQAHFDQLLRKKEEEVVSVKAAVDADISDKVAQLSEAAKREKELQKCLEEINMEKDHFQQRSVKLEANMHHFQEESSKLSHQISVLNSQNNQLRAEKKSLAEEIEAHKLTAMTYREDFESERKDREAAHNKIADVEKQYRHQLEGLSHQLQQTTASLNEHKVAMANTEDLLCQQQHQMQQQTRQKEEEMAAIQRKNNLLKEEVMSKTQQVKQYRKQVDQLNMENSTYRRQAEGHMKQIEFYASKTYQMEKASPSKERLLREVHERKQAELEIMCDKLRAENQKLLTKVDHYERGGGVMEAMRSPPRAQAKSEGGMPKKLLTKGNSYEEDLTHHSPVSPGAAHRPPPSTSDPTASPARHHYNSSAPPHPSSSSAPPHPSSSSAPPRPSSNALSGVMDRGPGPSPQISKPGNLGMVRPSPSDDVSRRSKQPNYSAHVVVDAYSSLPSSGLGCRPQMVNKPPVERDFQLSANNGHGHQPPLYPPQRKVQSQLHSIVTTDGRPKLPQSGGPAPYNIRPTANDHIYYNLTPLNYPPPHPGSQFRPLAPTAGGQGQPLHLMSSTANELAAKQRQPPPVKRYSTPMQESVSQAATMRSPASNYRASQTPPRIGGQPRGQGHPRPGGRGPISPPPSTSSSDVLSSGIDKDIRLEASKIKCGDCVGEEGGSEAPPDPNLLCPKCGMQFREGEIQKFRKHMSSPH